jgi:hypothetical protein
VAVSAIAAPIANSVSQKIVGTQGNLTPFASTSPVLAKTVAGFASSTVTELTRVAIQGGKLNWVSIASSTAQAFTSAAIGSYQAKANALNQPVYADNFDADRKARAQMFGLGGNNAESNTPSVLRLSDDEVYNNAMARQEAEKGFNGLRASYVDSPQQINAKNGGANFSYGDALGNGVVYGKEQYMNGAVKAGAEAINNENAAIKYAQDKFASIGEDGLRTGPTIERSNLRKNTYSSDIGTIRAERPNIVRDNPIIVSPVRIAGDLVSYFRDDGINPATERPRSTKPYAGLTLAVEAITTFGPLVELRGLMGAGKLSGVGINGATRNVPLGLESESQFLKASQELREIMSAQGINDATIGVRGSSVTGFGANPKSPTYLQPFGANSDIDFFVQSSKAVNQFKGQPNFVHPDNMVRAYPALETWSQKWTGILGRPVSPAAWRPSELPTTPTILVK